MITPMTKLTMLIYHRDYKQFLLDLREHGVVHVQAKKKTLQNDTMKAKMMEMKHVSNTIKLLEKRPKSENPVKTDLRNRDLIDFIDSKYNNIETIQQQMLSLQKEDNVYLPWGHFPEETLKQIQSNNWDMRFFTVPSRKYDNHWEEEFNAFLINEISGLKYFTTLTPKGKEPVIEADKFQFPTLSKSEIKAQVEEKEKELKEENQYLNDVAEDAIAKLQSYKIDIKEDADFYKVSEAAEYMADDKILSLEGWVPAEIEANTIKWLDKEDIYYEASKPVKNVDNPPIKLKNNPFARLFEMIGDMYSIPTYWELDMVPFFAPFFVIFFGFCLGDCGYGLLMMLVTIVLILTKKLPKMQNILWLGFFLGLGTVIMGTISGTFFGIQLLKIDTPFVNNLKTIMFKEEGLYSAFNVSLFIGVFQILFGMCLKIINQTKMYGFSSALSTIGWVVVLLGGGVSYLVVGGVSIAFYICLIVGGVLIFIFNSPIKKFYSPIVNIGSGLWDTYNMATGLLGDVLSYIRLFALGLSGSILGLVFNDLAIRMSPDIPVVKQLVMIIILILGHTMNIGLSGLSAVVHPMRLTFVEFYKNAGFKGGAKKYEPFRKMTVNN